ncbi:MULTISPECIES: PadR family transcriptional regulator [unclassified Microbacterium]|uniref:PadR family transcriptional regulator n=1 Tax=unclassified Microbacterium TaxID=2609290 RepID=UPI003015BE54
MKLENLLLGILLIAPRTGYELSRYMEMEGVFMRPRTQMSQVYRSLAQMSERGWARYTVSTRPGAQDAKIYEATEAGREVFLTWLRSPFVPTLGPVDFEFRARVYFCGFLDAASLLRLVDTELSARKQQIATHRFRDRTIEASEDSAFDVEFATEVDDLMHAWGAASMDLMVSNLERVRDAVRARVG